MAKGAAAEELLADRYRLVRAVARHPHATLWCAVDEVLARPVAVKTLDDAKAVPGGAKAFLDAAVRASRLSHPRLAAVYDADTAGKGRPFVVTEWVEGESLAERLADGPLTPARATTVTAQAAEVLAYVHAQDFPHGDLDTRNVLVCGDGSVKVTDVGIGAVLAASEGTTRDGDDSSARDARALGALLYACLTGKSAFGNDPGLPLAPRRNGTLLRPRQVRPSVPRELDEVVVRALGLDPAAAKRRLVSPAQVLKALAPLPGEGARPGPAPLPAAEPKRTRAPWWVRHGFPVVVVVVLAVLALQFGQRVGELEGPDQPFARLTRPPSAAPAPGTPLKPVAVRDFDPDGDGAENPRQVELAYDGEVGTAWVTGRYRTAALSGRKPGVGLLFDFGQPVDVTRVHVVCQLKGVGLEIRAADTVAADASGADLRLVTSQTNAPEVADLRPTATTRARYWLVWVTQLVRTDTSREFPFAAALAEVTFYRP